MSGENVSQQILSVKSCLLTVCVEIVPQVELDESTVSISMSKYVAHVLIDIGKKRVDN